LSGFPSGVANEEAYMPDELGVGGKKIAQLRMVATGMYIIHDLRAAFQMHAKGMDEVEVVPVHRAAHAYPFMDAGHVRHELVHPRIHDPVQHEAETSILIMRAQQHHGPPEVRVG